MTFYKMTICYDGTRYRGWQKQGNTHNTIQYKFETALSNILSQDIEVNASGRTDAGVHAIEQVVSFRADTIMSAEEIKNKLTDCLPEDIGILKIELTDSRFHARLSCKCKTYMYRIWNDPSPCVFERKYSYEFKEYLNIELMREAASYFIGEHDFAAFCTNKRMKHTTIRNIKEISITKSEHIITIRYTGNGFLYNMVRIMTGTLIDVGTGKIPPSDIEKILKSKDRSLASFTAPSRGLFLEKLYY